MSIWLKLSYILLSLFFIWRLFIYLRHNPEAFSKENLGKSFFTSGMLGLVLICFVALLVFIVKKI